MNSTTLRRYGCNTSIIHTDFFGRGEKGQYNRIAASEEKLRKHGRPDKEPAIDGRDFANPRAWPKPRSLALILLAPILLFQLVFADTALAKEINIGVRAYLGPASAMARWQATADFLSKEIDGYSFKLIPYKTPEAIVLAAKNGKIEYAIIDPSTFVRIEVKSRAEKIASLANAWQGKPLNRFGSVIFSLNTNADILSLQDLRGKSLMAVTPNGFEGWQMVKEEFAEHSLTPNTYLGELTFAGGNQRNVVSAVLAGTVDVGVVRTGVLEKMDAQGILDISKLHVIAPRKVAGFPFRLSTDLYPEWAFAALPGAPRLLGTKIFHILQTISPTSRPAVEGGYFGWQAALNYDPVYILLQLLQAPPFENYGAASFRDVVWNYRYWIAALSISIIGLIALLLIVVKRQDKHSKTTKELLLYKARDLDFARAALDEHAVISMADSNGNITYVNEKFCEISRYSRDELIGQNHRILKSGAHGPEFYAEMNRVLWSGNVWRGEIQNRRKDGSFYWVKTTIIPQMDDKGRPQKFVSIRTDITQAKQDQAALNMQEFFELVQDEVYMFYPHTLKFFYANQRAQKIIGMSTSEISEKTPMDITPGIEEEQFRKSLESLIDGRRSKLFYDTRRQLPEGGTVASEITIQYIKTDHLPPRFIGTITDVSGRKAAEDEASQLRDTLNNIDDEIYLFWPDSKRFFFANKAAQQRLGMRETELFQLTPSEIEGGLPKDECDALMKLASSGKKGLHSFIRRVENPDGEERLMETNIRYVTPSGKKPRFLVTIYDVSDREATHEKYRQLDASLDLMAAETYMFWPETYKFMYLNKSALKRFAWDKSEWHGKATFDNISPAAQTKLEEHCKTLINGDAKSASYEVVDRNGTPLEISLHLIEPKGEKPRFLSIYRDISEQKKVEIAKSEFVSTVSHELRTPLTSIMGALGLMRMETVASNPQKSRDLLDMAYTNVNRLAALVNDLLDWEKMEAGKLTYHMEDIDLSELIHASVAANQPYAKNHDITFVVTDFPARFVAKGDKNRLMQVMANLLSNAAKFSCKGSNVKVTLEQIGETARISVKDSGCGIPKDAQATIFNKFTQADSSDQRHVGGTGLGLSIVKAMIKAHGGNVDFVSEEGKGTTFFFELPKPTVDISDEAVEVCNVAAE